MKTSNKLLIGFLSIITLSMIAMMMYSKSKIINDIQRSHSDNYKKDFQDMKGFKSLEISTNGDVTITSGEELLSIESDSFWFANSRIEIKDSILYIFDPEKNHSSPDINITMKNLAGIKLLGSSDIIMKDIFNTDHIDLVLTGSGSIDSKVNSNSITAILLGSGEIANHGKAQSITLQMTGSGTINFDETEAKDANIQLLGSGDVNCNASNSIKGNLSGSGDINYKGNPTVQLNQIGSGNINKQQ